MVNLLKIHLSCFIALIKAYLLQTSSLKIKSNIAKISLAILINIGMFAGVAQATTQQVILNLDSVSSRSFLELLARAEILATIEVSQQFQNNPTLTEIQVLVLGERSGQIVSILSSQLTREAWENSADLRPWTRYFTSASVLLGYTNSSQVARRQRPNASSPSVSNSSIASNPQTVAAGTTSISNNEISLYPREEVGDAMINGEISVDEYWELLDALD